MRLLQLANQELVKSETREPYVYPEPRVNPSNLSAYLSDTRRNKVAGSCNRAVAFHLMGVPKTEQTTASRARIFAVGRFFESMVTESLKKTGLFVASGIRVSIPGLVMSLELDIAALEPFTNRGIICENKTVKGEWNMKQIHEGHAKLENLMQICIYLDQIPTGAELKRRIREGLQDRSINEEFKDKSLNRIEVNEENLAKMDDGPLTGRLFYQDREQCEDGELVIGLWKDPENGLTYPTVEGVPQRDFCLESVYQRRIEIQRWWTEIVQEAKEALSKAGFQEPEPPASPFGLNWNDPVYKKAKSAYWNRIGEYFQMLPPSRWPECDYQYEYPADKLTYLKNEKLLRKGEITSANKGERVGDFNCAYCDWKSKCVAVEYPKYRHHLLSVNQIQPAPNPPPIPFAGF